MSLALVARHRSREIKPPISSLHLALFFILIPCFQTAPILSEPRTLSPVSRRTYLILVGKFKWEKAEEVGEMVRIIPMATSFRPSLSSFGFSTSSRLGFPLSTFNISRTVTSLHVGSGKSSFHALEFCFSSSFILFFLFCVAQSAMDNSGFLSFFVCFCFCFFLKILLDRIFMFCLNQPGRIKKIIFGYTRNRIRIGQNVSPVEIELAYCVLDSYTFHGILRLIVWHWL